ncbi:hypothetical protein Tco_0004643 [Tanacetum coccineum]
MDPVEKLKPNTGKPVDQLEYSRAIGCLMYAMISTRPDIAYAVGRLSRYPSWNGVFLLGGGAISWASKKQTCNTSSTIESEFVALAAAGKEAEWLRNLIHEIPIRPKPIAPNIYPMNGVISIEFVRMQHNLADHLTKGLARDLVGDWNTVSSFPRICVKDLQVMPLQEALGLSFLYVLHGLGDTWLDKCKVVMNSLEVL